MIILCDKDITYKLGNYKGWIEQSANSGLPMHIPMSSVQFSSLDLMAYLECYTSNIVWRSLAPLIGGGNDITSSGQQTLVLVGKGRFCKNSAASIWNFYGTTFEVLAVDCMFSTCNSIDRTSMQLHSVGLVNKSELKLKVPYLKTSTSDNLVASIQ